MPRSVPNYLTTLASGDVQAIFPGGVIINAVVDGTVSPPVDRAVEWVKETDGSYVASVYGIDSSNHLIMGAGGTMATPRASIDLAAGAPGGELISILAGAAGADLLRNNGSSDYAFSGNVLAFEVKGTPNAVVAIPRPFRRIAGIFRSTGYVTVAGAVYGYQVGLTGIITLASADFPFNTANEHTTLVCFSNTDTGAVRAAGNYTFNINYDPAITFDGSDRFGGLILPI